MVCGSLPGPPRPSKRAPRKDTPEGGVAWVGFASPWGGAREWRPKNPKTTIVWPDEFPKNGDQTQKLANVPGPHSPRTGFLNGT